MKHPWAAFYWGDYFADTVHLTQGQHGAYLLLLGRYHANGEPLLANAEQLQRVCRANTKQERSNVDAVLSEFFILTDGMYHNNRADEELAKRSEISTKRSLAAQKKGSSKSTANAEQKHTQPQPHIQPQDLKSKPVTVSLKFALPSIGEITAYCNERKNRIDPQQFFDYYTANGWKVGRNLMRDWRAAVRTWERNNFTGGGNGTTLSKAEQRTVNTRKALCADAGFHFDEDAGPVGEALPDGDSAGGTEIVGEIVGRGTTERR